MLRWRLKVEEYGLNIEYIKGKKNVLECVLSIFLINGNTETIREYTYKKKNSVRNK